MKYFQVSPPQSFENEKNHSQLADHTEAGDRLDIGHGLLMPEIKDGKKN